MGKHVRILHSDIYKEDSVYGLFFRGISFHFDVKISSDNISIDKVLYFDEHFVYEGLNFPLSGMTCRNFHIRIHTVLLFSLFLLIALLVEGKHFQVVSINYVEFPL